MKNYPAAINDPALSGEDRLSALRSLEASASGSSAGSYDRSSAEINMHVHTIYSFSPYSPSMAALRSRDARLGAAASVDHDSIAATGEMLAACAILGIGGSVGFELRVSFKSDKDGKPGPFASRIMNNPDSAGYAYMTVQGIPGRSIKKAAEFLAPIRAERLERSRAMTISLNAVLREAGFSEIDFDGDIFAGSKYGEGGGITERHLLWALAEKIIQKFGKGPALADGLKSKMGLTVPPEHYALLADPDNPHYLYDLLGLLKAGFLPGIFIQPNERECIPAADAAAFARSISAIPAYPYIGDNKAGEFEDDFIEELIAEISRLGFQALAITPERNTADQLRRIRGLAADWGLMEIAGADINSSRQSFNCPEVLREESRHLLDSGWALVAHERLASLDEAYGLFSEKNPISSMDFQKRLAFYAKLGKKLDLKNPDESAAALAEELKKDVLFS
ncbi:MAG: PHP domain-containing protein [Treponema sp.]|nr:PHP domain-containing protein [Treponema sp.]